MKMRDRPILSILLSNYYTNPDYCAAVVETMDLIIMESSRKLQNQSIGQHCRHFPHYDPKQLGERRIQGFHDKMGSR